MVVRAENCICECLDRAAFEGVPKGYIYGAIAVVSNLAAWYCCAPVGLISRVKVLIAATGGAIVYVEAASFISRAFKKAL